MVIPHLVKVKMLARAALNTEARSEVMNSILLRMVNTSLRCWILLDVINIQFVSVDILFFIVNINIEGSCFTAFYFPRFNESAKQLTVGHDGSYLFPFSIVEVSC